ncbi:MAG: hypothetical protein JWO33_2574 [Caulobacteraceae bacterium]|nr:hypothetical protein [Caulobacteraceae bacterium]
MATLSKFSLIAVGAGLVLGGCAVSRQHLTSDYGRALRQDAVAQIADPDARYKGDPAPASNGARTSLAQTRYERGTVIQPASTSTSTVVATSGGGGGGQ